MTPLNTHLEKLKNKDHPFENLLPLSTRVLNFITWVALLLPFVIYLWTINKYAINIPVWDDYDAVLNFINEFLLADNLLERFRLLYAQHNEHRILVSRAIYLAQYILFGEVNFRILLILGNLAWISTLTIIMIWLKKEFNFSLAYLVPLPYLWLSFVHEDIMLTTAMSPIQNYGSVLICVLIIYLLANNRITFATLLFPIALFSSGPGLLLLPLGSMFLFFRQEWKSLLVFSIPSSLFVFFYYNNFHPVIQHPNPVDSLINFEQTIAFGLALLGSIIRENTVAIPLGLLSIGALIFYILKLEGLYFLRLLAIFTGMVAITTSISRSGFGGNIIPSRYTIYSILGLVGIYLFVVIAERHRLFTSKFLLATWVISALFFFGVLAKLQLSGSFEQRNAEKVNGIASFIVGEKRYLPYPNSPKAKNILQTSKQLGVYDFTVVTSYLQEPSSVNVDMLLPITQYQGNIELYNGLRMSGWALIPDSWSYKSEIDILLNDGKKTFQIETFRGKRPDVSTAFQTQFMYDDSGYIAYLSNSKVPLGNYQVGVMVKVDDQIAIHWSDFVYVPSSP